MENKKHIGFKINHLSRLLRQDLNNHAAALDLTASQSFLLGYLVHHQGQTIYQKDLERQFNFTHATASGREPPPSTPSSTPPVAATTP